MASPLSRRLVLWALLLALPIQGGASAVLQLLGPVHRHAAAAADPVAQGVSWLVGQWKQWQHFAHRQAHEAATPGHAEHDHADRDQADEPHHHDAFERHHHAPGGDLVLLGGHEAGGEAAGEPGAAGSGVGALLPLLLAVGLIVPRPPSRRQRRALPLAALWRSAATRRLERPPRT